jgi:hypothetical protein
MRVVAIIYVACGRPPRNNQVVWGAASASVGGGASGDSRVVRQRTSGL